MQSVIEDDAIHVGEGILQQKKLRLHMLSKVPCCPAIGGPENTEGCLLGEDVQEELSVGRITLNKENKLGGMPPCAESVLFLGACNTSSSSMMVIDCFQPGLAGRTSQARLLTDRFDRGLPQRARTSTDIYVLPHPKTRTSVRPGPPSHTPSQHILLRRLPEHNGLHLNYFSKKNYVGPRVRSSMWTN